MSTDFFERQDHARRQTFRLLVLFAIAVVIIIAAIYFVVVIALDPAVSGGRHVRPHSFGAARLWNPVVLAWVTLGTGLVVSLGSIYKIAELSAGGESVALMMGGRAIDPRTGDLAERRLLNIVEEMALASGVPVPPCYVLENEPGINAFAAGHQPSDAVVAVSRGCLNYLTREEIQGVIGHEFSHILNGDMRLNLRLIGIVHGILVLSIVGYYVMRSAGMVSSDRDEKKNGGATAIFLVGLALLILGYLGVFLGKIIKSAISRQREFLADASAVQFTRDPGGIAGALKKIGGLTEGSQIHDPHAEEVSHMFFGDAFANSMMNLFATHPPLDERIRRLEPDFDGRFPEVEPLRETGEPDVRRPTRVPAAGTAAAGAAMAGLAAGSVTQRIGQPGAEHLDQASRMVAGMPSSLAEAAREPYSARAVVFALLLGQDSATQGRQIEVLEGMQDPPLLQATRQFAATVRNLAPESRLPMIDLATAALRKLSPQQYVQFRGVVEALVAADGRVDLFEYCLRTVLFSYLDVAFGLKKPAAVRYRSLAPVVQPALVVLSSLAYAGADRPDEAQQAFAAGASELSVQASLLPPAACTFPSFDDALAELAQASPQVKRQLMAAVAACIAADGRTTLKENELLRAVGAALSCPIPPVPQ